MHPVLATVLVTVLVATLAVAALLPAAKEARADLTVCNDTDRRVGVAIGHPARDGVMSEGWWNFHPGECQPILRGNLSGRYYYLYAVDYDLNGDGGGDWGGDSLLCISDGEFVITGSVPNAVDCSAGDSRAVGFHEMDIGGVRNQTVRLSLGGWGGNE